jgi:Domain of unknown function (DUF222)
VFEDQLERLLAAMPAARVPAGVSSGPVLEHGLGVTVELDDEWRHPRTSAVEVAPVVPAPEAAAPARPDEPVADNLDTVLGALSWAMGSGSWGLEEVVERGHGLGLALALVDRLGLVGSVSGLGADGQLAMLAGFDKVSAWAAAMQRRMIGALATGRDGAAGPGVEGASAGDREAAGDREGSERRWLVPAEYTADEVAVVLRCSVRAAQGLVGESMDLVQDLPETLAALEEGRITVPVARAITDETGHLEPGVRRAVEAVVLPRAGSRTPARTRRAVRSAIVRIEPAAARAREVRARQGRCVRTSPSQDGMAHLDLYAGVAEVAAAYENIDRHADALARQPGEDRGREALRADLAAAALQGRIFLGDPDHLAAAVAAGCVTRLLPTALSPVAEGNVDGPQQEAPAGMARRRPAVRAEIVVTGADTTLAGLDDRPGELAGYGPVTAQTLRDLAADADVVHAVRTDPDTGGVTDLTVVHPLQPDDRPSRRDADPDGERERERLRNLVDAANEAVRQQQRNTAAPSAESAGAGRAQGGQAADAYTPPAALRRYIVARDRTCRFPGCSRRAAGCDLDHTIPYPQGRTEPGNLGALCRRHHRLKQTRGWRLEQPEPGIFVWTTPTGHTYTVRPPDPLTPD